MREILKGAVDLHIHTGPSIADREMDAVQMLKEAEDAGYRAIVIKDHYAPTVMSARLIEEHCGKKGVKVFGGISLNNAVGGLNLYALDAATRMGGMFLWMPTVSTSNHMSFHKGGHFAGSGKNSLEEKPIEYLNAQGNLCKEALDIIDYAAQNPKIVFATGHGTPGEVNALVEGAAERKVKKIYVNHPFSVVNASVEEMIRWANMGATIELNACSLVPESKYYGEHVQDSPKLLSKIFENIGFDQLVMVSDYGQKGNGSPVQGMLNFVKLLLEVLKIGESDINTMLKTNPAKLLEIDEVS